MSPTTKKEVTPEGVQAAARIATARANKNAGGQRQGATISAPVIASNTTKDTTPTTISSETLAPTATPTVASSTPTPTQNAALSAEIEDVTNQYTQNLQKEADTLGANRKTQMDSFLETLQGQQGETTRIAQEYSQKGGVDDITVELNDINDRIRREQLAMRRATEAVQKQGGGLQMGANAEIANIERDSIAKQADLAVIQMAVQGRYDSAKAIADRAVSAQLEQQTNELAVMKFNYDENKELYTKAEQRAFESAQADRERALTEEKDNKLAIKSFALSALEAGASTSEVQQAMNAKTLDEAIALVGGYLRPKPVAGSTKPTITEIDGKDYIWNETTGQFEPAPVSGAGTLSDDQTQQLNQTLALARELKNPATVGKGSAVGASAAKFLPFGMSLGLQGNRAAFENKVNTLKANLTLENLGLLKGPMSDKDLAFLQAVGSSLTTNMSEAEFDKELDKVISRLNKAAGITSTNFEVNPYLINSGSLGLLNQNNIQVAPDGTQIEIID